VVWSFFFLFMNILNLYFLLVLIFFIDFDIVISKLKILKNIILIYFLLKKTIKKYLVS
jgi:hypothetical protein